MNFPNLLSSDTEFVLSNFDVILRNNQHLENKISFILNKYNFNDRSMKSYLISICYTLIDLNLASMKPFKDNFNRNISELAYNNSINMDDVKAIDQCIEEITSLDWK